MYIYIYIDSLIHWFVDSLIHWFIDALIHWFIDSLIHWFIESLFYWFIDSLTLDQRNMVYSAWISMCSSPYVKDKTPAEFRCLCYWLSQRSPRKSWKLHPKGHQNARKMWLLGSFLVFFSGQGTICHHSSTTGVQGRPGIDFRWNFGVIWESFWEPWGIICALFPYVFCVFCSSLFSEVFFSSPGQTLNGFGIHSGFRWELFSMIWMTFAGSGDSLFLNNTIVV